MHFSDAITEYCFDCKVRKLSPKSISNYQKQLKYLQRYMSQCRTKDAYQKEFNNIRLLSKGQPVLYQYVRQWFKKKFPLFGSIDVQYDAEGFIVERIEEKVKATSHPLYQTCQSW